MSWRSVLQLAGRKPPPPLPEAFLFGVATADHQVEAYDATREDIRDVWERLRGQQPRLRATDFANHYKEDIARAAEMGCTAFRFSIAWSRVEPVPGQYDDAVFDYYADVVRHIRDAGMQAVLTLLHFTWPIWLEDRGGLIAEDFPATYGRYVEEVARRFGPQVEFWITFNEPTLLPYGYLKAFWEANYNSPPGLPPDAGLERQVAAVAKLMRNLFVAHTQARGIIKRYNPHALVATNPLLTGLPVWIQRFIDNNATRVKSFEDMARHEQRLAERRMLEMGKVDVVLATLTRTPERDRQLMFSDIYYVAGQALLVRADQAPAQGSQTSPAGRLIGRAVAVVRSSTAEAGAPSLLPGARLRVVTDYRAALAMLDAGEVDALLADDTILRGFMRQLPGRFALLAEGLTEEPYAAAVAPGNGDLVDVIDLALRDFKLGGEWAASYARHLGQPVPEPPPATERALAMPGRPLGHVSAPGPAKEPLPLARPGTALRRVQDRGCLVLAVKADVPGFGYRDPQSGTWEGLEIDLARAVACRIFGEAKVRFVPATTRERIPLLRSLLRFLDPVLRDFAILSSTLTSNWWHLGMAGKLPDFLCPPECVGQQDFIGLDYYWGVPALRIDRIQALIASGTGRFDAAPVWPGALYRLLRYHASLEPGKPLLIVENGSVDVADGVARPAYIRRHVEQVQRAAADGVNVLGYICWSITSNREWGLKFTPASDFGLYHIDLDTDPDLTRRATAAVEEYRQIIADHGVVAGNGAG